MKTQITGAVNVLTESKAEPLGHRIVKLKLGHQTMMSIAAGVLLIIFFKLYQSEVQPFIDDYRDVLVNVQYEEILKTKDKLVLRIKAEKNLKAYYVPNSEEGELFADGAWHQAKFRYMNDPSPNSSRPRSRNNELQDFGAWEWSGDMSHVTASRLWVQHYTNFTISKVYIDGVAADQVTGRHRYTLLGPFPVTWGIDPVFNELIKKDE